MGKTSKETSSSLKLYLTINSYIMIRYFKESVNYLLSKRRFPQSKMHKGSSVDANSKLGENSTIFSGVILQSSIVGDYSYIQSRSILVHAVIGKFCSIASDVQIGLAAHPTSMVSTSPVFYDNTQPLPNFFIKEKKFSDTFPKTIISSDVWVGQGALIKAGIVIGVGAVVGAGAVVTKDVKSYSIVGGVPAKHIRYRFEKEIREELMASKWWDLDQEKLTNLAKDFSDPVEFLKNKSLVHKNIN